MLRERTIAVSFADLVGAIGTDFFADRFLKAMTALAGVDLCSVFVRGRRQPLRLLFAEGQHPMIADFPIRASLDYIRDFWRSDREIVALMRSSRKLPIIVRKSAADISDPAWRAACYERAGVAERISIVSAGPPTFIANGYRLDSAHAIGVVEMEKLQHHAPMLMAALERHEHVRSASGNLLSEAELTQSLMALQCGLSTREAEISAAMMLGETQEEIAHRKRLSHGSVVTYRRRAYGKLGIDNRRGLLQLHRRLMASISAEDTAVESRTHGRD